MSNEHTVDLIRALIENLEGADDNWESFSIIVSSYERKFNSASGYAYSPDGTISAITTSPWKVVPFVDTYVSDYYKPGEKLPIKLLVQFERTSGNYNINFEDTDELRWKITPDNFKEFREEIRPNFSETNTATTPTGANNE